MKLPVCFIMLITITPLNVNADLSELPIGESSNISESGEILKIDYRFVTELKNNPSIKRATENFWELVYFINLGDKDAIEVGIILLAENVPLNVLHDRYGVQYIARALSQTDEFWYVLKNNDKETIIAVINYYQKFPDQYENMESFEYMKSQLLKKVSH